MGLITETAEEYRLSKNEELVLYSSPDMDTLTIINKAMEPQCIYLGESKQ